MDEDESHRPPHDTMELQHQDVDYAEESQTFASADKTFTGLVDSWSPVWDIP